MSPSGVGMVPVRDASSHAKGLCGRGTSGSNCFTYSDSTNILSDRGVTNMAQESDVAANDKGGEVPRRSISAIAMLALVFGVFAFVLAVTPGFAVSFLFAIPGLVLGIIAVAKRKQPFGLSVSGLVISATSWFLSIVVAVVVVAVTAASMVSSNVSAPDPSPSVSNVPTPKPSPSVSNVPTPKPSPSVSKVPTPKRAPSVPNVPAGFQDWNNGLGTIKIDGTCDSGTRCIWYQVYAYRSCPTSVYVEGNIYDAGGTIIDMTNDIVGSMAKGESATVNMKTYNQSAAQMRLTEVECY
jgi:hypothetical protein